MFISIPQIEVFLLIFARIMGLFIEAPIFSAKSIPSPLKVAFAIWLTTILWFVVPVRALPDSLFAFMLAIVSEIIIGFILGFVSSLVLQCAQAAGDVLDLQMGLSVANVLSPTTGQMTSITGTFLYFIALVVFLLVDGHHMVLSALHQSFVAIPIVSFVDFSRPNLVIEIMSLMTFFWISTIQLCAPILLLIFLMRFLVRDSLQGRAPGERLHAGVPGKAQSWIVRYHAHIAAAHKSPDSSDRPDERRADKEHIDHVGEVANGRGCRGKIGGTYTS